jgi:hypothetical protein
MWAGLTDLRRAMRGRWAARGALFLLALFVLQISVARSHFHFDHSERDALALAGDVTGGSPHPKPAHDEANCPLWHAGVAGGSALLADACVLLPPPATRSLRVADARTIFPERFTAAWRSRAPPIV